MTNTQTNANSPSGNDGGKEFTVVLDKETFSRFFHSDAIPKEKWIIKFKEKLISDEIGKYVVNFKSEMKRDITKNEYAMIFMQFIENICQNAMDYIVGISVSQLPQIPKHIELPLDYGYMANSWLDYKTRTINIYSINL